MDRTFYDCYTQEQFVFYMLWDGMVVVLTQMFFDDKRAYCNILVINS